MSQNTLRLNALFKLYLDDSISAEEYKELLELLDVSTINQSLSSELRELWTQSSHGSIGLPPKIWDDRLNFLLQQMDAGSDAAAPIEKISRWYRVRWAAAILLILLSSVTYYLLKKPGPSLSTNAVTKNNVMAKDMMPGGNKAVLTLADGTSIVLDSSANGTIASQGNTKVIKLNTGELAYNSAGNVSKETLFNTLSTPRGGQYQLRLPDGTMVWLNSASSLRYPTVFKGAERKVEITGEAYFEVAKNPAWPFKVKINLSSGEGGEVEVLGTHFNIKAYEDEALVRTTLLVGSVKVNHSAGATTIKPGQQLQYSNSGQLRIINNADLEEAIAWKEGRFYFEDADIGYVMRQIARWYNIEVEYKSAIHKHFDGVISKNVSVSKVLQMLEMTGEVKFKIEGDRVVVIP